MLPTNRNQPFFPPKRSALSSLSVFIPLLNSGLLIDDPADMLNSADWIGSADIEFVDAQLRIEVEIGSECLECTTEWRLGFRAIDSEVSAPELMLSHTITEVWWDENISWQYPNHMDESLPFMEQVWISHQGNLIIYTIPLSNLPETLWTGLGYCTNFSTWGALCPRCARLGARTQSVMSSYADPVSAKQIQKMKDIGIKTTEDNMDSTSMKMHQGASFSFSFFMFLFDSILR